MKQESHKIQIIYYLAIIIICWAASFLNYSIIQIIGAYPAPLTVIPLFIALTVGYNIPATAILLIGLSDDFFLNAPLCFFSAIYLFLAYVLSLNFKNMQNKKAVILAFLIIFFAINLIGKG